jgi:hypothetical protein
MDCEEFLQEYSDYFDWRLEGRPLSEYREHLSSCGRCAEYDRVMRSGLHLVKDIEPPQAAADCVTRVQRRVIELQSRLGRRTNEFGLTLAVAGLTAIGILFISSLPVLRSADPLELPPVVVEIDPASGELPSVFGPAPRFAPAPSLLRVPDFSSEGLLTSSPDRPPLFRAPLRTSTSAASTSEAAVTR